MSGTGKSIFPFLVRKDIFNVNLLNKSFTRTERISAGE